MKDHLSQGAVAIAGLFLSLLIPHSAQAYTFGQEEVDQSKFIAIAVPFAEGKQYNLIILEQISATQDCWQEKADQPGVIDPLLLKFDFTGICGRSTDSNGYSIRQAGQDLALDYRLSIVKQKGQLVLMGYPVRNPQVPKLKIGQTQTHTNGFLKIELEPGWRFAKRTYNGKTLGHIYFTRDEVPRTEADTLAEAPADAVPPLESEEDLPLPTPTVDSLPPLTPAQPLPTATDRSQDSGTLTSPNSTVPQPQPTVEGSQDRDKLTDLITSPIKIPVTNQKPPQRSAPQTAPSHARKTPGAIALPRPETDPDLPELSGESPPPQPLTPSSSKHYHSPSAPSAAERRKLVKIIANSPSSPGIFSRPIQIPVPPPRRLTVAAPTPKTSPALAIPEPDEADVTADDILFVPQGDIPLGRFDADSDIYIASRDGGSAAPFAPLNADEPPPPPLDDRSRLRYRVVVQITDGDQQTQIKRLVPDAFRSSYQGNAVWQVGAYESQAEADERLNWLGQAGLTGIIEVR